MVRTAAVYTDTHIDNAQKELEKLIAELSAIKRTIDVIRGLRTSIEKALALGGTWTKINATLKVAKVEVSVAMLRRYWNEIQEEPNSESVPVSTPSKSRTSSGKRKKSEAVELPPVQLESESEPAAEQPALPPALEPEVQEPAPTTEVLEIASEPVIEESASVAEESAPAPVEVPVVQAPVSSKKGRQSATTVVEAPTLAAVEVPEAEGQPTSEEEASEPELSEEEIRRQEDHRIMEEARAKGFSVFDNSDL